MASDTRLSVHFSMSEVASHDGRALPDELRGNLRELIEMLEQIRVYAGVSLHVVSGYRSPGWNAKVGGAKGSAHLTAQAADVRSKSMPSKELHTIILEMFEARLIPELGGLGLYQGWTHVDVKRYPDAILRRWNGNGVGSEPSD